VSLNSFSFNTCIISPMISKYLILMSMTCAETQEMTPRGPFLTEAPLIRPDSLDCDHSTDYSLSGYSINFTSRRSLPSFMSQMCFVFSDAQFSSTTNASFISWFSGTPSIVTFGSSSLTQICRDLHHPSVTHRYLCETVYHRISIKMF